MKVTNPNPCLVNVSVNGDYVRIGPGQTKDVPEKAIAALVKAGALVVADTADSDDSRPKRLTAPQIKEALAERGVTIPEGVTKRDDLQALLDAASLDGGE